MLGNTVKFDHGYSRDSTVITHFLRLLAALDSPDQRRFLRFVTGSPRLPPGGLVALQVPVIPRVQVAHDPLLTFLSACAVQCSTQPARGMFLGYRQGFFPPAVNEHGYFVIFSDVCPMHSQS